MGQIKELAISALSDEGERVVDLVTTAVKADVDAMFNDPECSVRDRVVAHLIEGGMDSALFSQGSEGDELVESIVGKISDIVLDFGSLIELSEKSGPSAQPDLPSRQPTAFMARIHRSNRLSLG